MEMAATCPECSAQVPQQRTGRRAVYCSDTCRARAYRARQAGSPRPASSRPNVIALRQVEPELLAWDPPSEPRKSCRTTESCPDCGEPLLAGRRGTWRACPACRRGVTPAAVSAPYARGDAAPQRQVASQREKDLAAIGLARRKGLMLAQLAVLADDDRLDPESVPVVGWFADEVRAAGSQDRLGELADLLREAGIRRRHWWQGQPAAIESPANDDDDDDDDWNPGPDRGGGRLSTAAPAIIPASELAARGYELGPLRAGRCQVTETHEGYRNICYLAGNHCWGDGQVCQGHYAALTTPLRARSA